MSVAAPFDLYPIRMAFIGGGGDGRFDVSNFCVLGGCCWPIWAIVQVLESHVKNSSRDSEFMEVGMFRRVEKSCNSGTVSFLLDES